jgi:V8-like Glu-specific endopeptidase
MNFDPRGGTWYAVVGVALLFTALTLVPAPAGAQKGVSSNSDATSQSDVKDYWTPQRLLNAKPLEIHPQLGADGLPIAPAGPKETGPSVSSPGAKPSVPASGNRGEILIPPEMLTKPQSQNDEFQFDGNVVIRSTSSYGARFTTTRVFPDAATTTYPFLTAGKLFFTDPMTDEDFVCSGSVLRMRIVVTAGHCVAEPSKNAARRYFFTNFMFVPAYNDGTAPVGSWTANQEYVANAWYHSNGHVPNRQDVAMLVITDGGTGMTAQKIGAVTGVLGYLTKKLGNNDVTMLGYPTNLDNGQRMEETYAHTFKKAGHNTFIYGSAMGGGASGGPWIMDFGVEPARTPPNTPPVQLGNNYLVGVSSYGPDWDHHPKPAFLGASNLGMGFMTILSEACAQAVGNC